MKTILSTLSLLLVALCTGAQQPIASDGSQMFKLNVLLDLGVNFMLTDTAWLTGENKSISVDWTRDRDKPATRYTYDNLIPGIYTFHARDFWGRATQRTLQLQHDTTLTIPTAYRQVTAISLKDLQQADSISMRYESKGCYHREIDQVALKKTKGRKSYTLTIINKKNGVTDKANNISPHIITDLHATLLAAKNVYNDEISTSTQSFWVLAGDKLFYFYDQAYEWRGYPYYTSQYIKRTKR